MKITTLALFALAALPLVSYGQASFDSSGNGKLNGTYYVRQVIYSPDFSNTSPLPGVVDEAITTYGNISFDGNGNYTFSGWYLDAASQPSAPKQFTSSGTYTVAASGMGFMTEFNNQEGLGASDKIIGLVNSKGIFIGSSTENTEAFSDLVIAAPVGLTQATNATLNGTYQVAYMDPYFFPTNAAVPGGDALFPMTANGSGNIGNINVTSFIGTSSASTETLSNVTYSFTNGAAQINFGGNTSTQLVAGSELLYISPDGNFVFGGSANGFDFFAGVRAATSNPSSYNALYYQAGLDLDNRPASNGYVIFDGYYGAINVFTSQSGAADIIGHQRLNAQKLYNGSADFTYYDTYFLNGDGSSADADFSQKYYSSADGTIRIGFGNAAGQLSLNVAFQAPTFSGSGVFLDPTGMVNAASSAPFTAFLSPGEFLTLYGANLSSGTAAATELPLPKQLNGVQVMINGRAAPIQLVSQNQINVIVPFFTESVAQIQVINNGSNSNVVTQFVGNSSAGAFTVPAGGIYDAAAEDVTNGYAIVSNSSPAQPGDAIAVFLAGLGSVTNQPQDGAAAPSDPPANVVSSNFPSVILYDANGNCQDSSGNCAITPLFAGLAPGFAGLYQINFKVPSGLASGYATLEIQAGPPDSDTVESILCLTACGSSNATQALHANMARRRALVHPSQLHRARPASHFKKAPVSAFRGQVQ